MGQSSKTSKCTGMSDCTCGCCGCGCGPSTRSFSSSEKEQKCLETYRDQLTKELAGVEERIREQRADSRDCCDE